MSTLPCYPVLSLAGNVQGALGQVCAADKGDSSLSIQGHASMFGALKPSANKGARCDM